MRLWLSVLALLVVAACAKPVAPERVTGIRTVGVISELGDRFHHREVGMTVFGNAAATSSIESWKFDDHVVREFGNALRRRYEVRAVSYPRGALAPELVSFPSEMATGTRRSIGEVVRTLVQPQGLDAYIIVTKAGSGFSNSNQGTQGLGVLHSTRGFASGTYMHALYRITVVDGRDFTVIGDATAPTVTDEGSRQKMAWGTPLMRGPFESTQRLYQVSSVNQLRPETQARLQADLRALLSRSVGPSLREVGLLDERDLASAGSAGVGGGGD